MIGLLSASGDERIVVLDISFGTPVRHVIAAIGEDVAPLNIGTIPASELVPWLRLRTWWQDRTVRIFPNVVNQTQVMTAFDQITLRVIGKLLQNLVASACDQVFICVIDRHHQIPLLQRSWAIKLSPKRHSIFPIQIVPFVQRHTERTRLRCANQKEKRHG